jgi:hypothetical protein
MGLDIYLYTAEQTAQNEAHDKASDELFARKERGEITEAQLDAEYEALPPYSLARSSYNGGGFNSAVPDFLGEPERGSLYWIFEPMGREWDGDEGLLTPDDLPKLAEARERAVLTAEALRKCDPLRASVIDPPPMGGADHLWHALPSADEVLAWFREELQRGSSFDSYSSAKGTVYKNGMEILAITHGRDVFGRPAPVIVYRSEALESYIQSAEIVAEFCDEARMLIERDGSVLMSWSG